MLRRELARSDFLHFMGIIEPLCAGVDGHLGLVLRRQTKGSCGILFLRWVYPLNEERV